MNNAHILGTERIGKLLVQYSIPAIIGMTITSLYNIIDSIFIGHGVGPMGIAGLADAHVYGNGSLQHNPRSHFHLPI